MKKFQKFDEDKTEEIRAKLYFLQFIENKIINRPTSYQHFLESSKVI